MPKPRKSPFAPGYIAIIERLISRRHELGMTQEDLARAYGEDQSFVSRVERRQRRIDVWEFVQFCRALTLDPGVVLNGSSVAGLVAELDNLRMQLLAKDGRGPVTKGIVRKPPRATRSPEPSSPSKTRHKEKTGS